MKKYISILFCLISICFLFTHMTSCNRNADYEDGIKLLSENNSSDEENGEKSEASDGLQYSLCDESTFYTVTGIGSFNGDSLIIPDSYNELPVEVIGQNAFKDCVQLKNISIPKSIKTIEKNAFYGCTQIEKIHFNSETMNDFKENDRVFYNAGANSDGIELIIGSSVTSIPSYLFYPFGSLGIPNIIKLTFDDKSLCKSIGEYSFYGCSNLKNAVIPEKVESIGISAFANCSSIELIEYKSQEFDSKKISPDLNFESIFYNSANGAKVLISKNVKEIPSIFGYSNISYLEFEKGSLCEIINEYAFTNCFDLLKVDIPSKMKEIKSCAFSGCPRLVEICNHSELNIKANNADYGFIGLYALNIYSESEGSCKIVKADDGFVFYDDGVRCSLLAYYGTNSDISLPDKYNGKAYDIYEYAFYENLTLKSITISDNVSSIGMLSFYECKNLVSVVFGSAVESIGYSAFENCTSLETVHIGKSIKMIKRFAFEGCHNVKTVTYDVTNNESNQIIIDPIGNDCLKGLSH